MSTESKIIRAIDFIETNLCNPMQSEDIALEANLSLRQLHRNFQDYTKDTLKNYVRVRRLTEASKILAYTDRSILDVAMDYQFESAAGFTRAFDRLFMGTPKNFREVGSPYIATQRQAINEEEYAIIRRGNQGAPKIIDMPVRHFVGKPDIQPHYARRVKENIKSGAIARALLHKELYTIQNLLDASEWNIASRRQNLQRFHDMEQFYCVEVTKPGKHSDDLISMSTPATQYAAFPHLSDDILVEFTISMAFHWLKNSPYFLGDAPALFHLNPGQKYSGTFYIPISPQDKTNMTWWSGYSENLQRLSKKKSTESKPKAEK